MQNRPKLIFLLVLVVIILFNFSNPAFSQDLSTKLFTKSDSLATEYPQEKIYLHLDRPSYWAGDDIWFKAYLKNTAIPNCNLYVELLDSAGNVIYKDICWAMQGVAYGDFELGDTIPSGMYQIRAYTSWLRNFDEQWFFRRDLVIWNLRDKQRESEFQKLKPRQVNVDLMPEGGTFIEGINNRIAFKVTDENGKGLEAEGVVIDKDRNHIVELKTGFKGMGSFEITPQPGKKYMAEMTIAGSIPKTIDLPEAKSTGVSIRYNHENTTTIHFEITEQTGNEINTNNSTYLLTGQTEGKLCYKEVIKIIGGKTEININKDNFPTGIVRFTLFDENMLPQCERLVFVNHHDQITVNITPNKITFKPREKVTLDLMALGKGNTPVISNLSLSAYPVETTNEAKTYPENIMTSFLLSSELKGKIEEPGYYFKDDSLSTITALDNVLLTHGYRYFSWEEVFENKRPEITFQPNSGIELKGKMISLLFHRPVSGGKVTMITLKSNLSVYEQITDSLGYFTFPSLYFMDTIQFLVQGRNEKGNRNIIVEIDKNVSKSPDIAILPVMYSYGKEDPSKSFTWISELSPELRNRKWRLSDTILLGDVNIVARKRNDDGHSRPYFKADFVIDVPKLIENNGRFSDIEDIIAQSAIARSIGRRARHIFVDGIPLELGIRIPADEWIDKIEYVSTAVIPGEGYVPAIFYYTKRGGRNIEKRLSPGIEPVVLVGYSVIRNFYSPIYDGSEKQEEKKDDYRNTLYWDPAIETNYKGEAEVSYYNSDQLGKVKIVVEGITYDGKLCRGIGSYEVIY